MPLTAIAYDFAGNTDRTTTVVRADTLAPVATLITPVPGAVVHGSQIDVVVRSPETDPGLFCSMTDTHVLNRVAGTDRWQARVVLPATGEVWLSLEDSAHNRTELKTTVRVRPPGADHRVRERRAGLAGHRLLGQYRTLPARTVVADNTPPSVAVTSAPANGARVTGTVKVAVKASDAAGIAHVELLVNGKVVARASTAGYLLTVDTEKVARTMKVQVRAYDRLGMRYTSVRTWRRR